MVTYLGVLSCKFIKYKKSNKYEEKNYVYFIGIIMGILGLLLVIGTNYLNFSEKFLLGIVGVGIALASTIIIVSIVNQFKSGDKNEIRIAKISIVLLIIILLIIVIIAYSISTMN